MDQSDQREPSEHDEQDEHPEPVAVASFATVGEAEVAQAKLQAYGIESALIDDVGGGTLPVEGEAGIVGAVPAKDADAARAALAPADET